MNPLVYIVMYGWIAVVLYLFRWLPPQRAIIVSFIGAWLFLPVAHFQLPVFPEYTKMSATCYGVLLATIVFDIKRFKSFQFSWLDLPMLIWCVCPFLSSVTNGLDWYDGLSALNQQTTTWGVPYYLGRLYLNDLDGLRKLAIGIFAGGIIYIPLCWFEIRFSPLLHLTVYGFNARENLINEFRYGGYRPTVFMETGLMVGAWMMAASLLGLWLWQTGVIKQLWGIPARRLIITLLVTFVFVKSTGAWFLLAMGLAILFAAKRFHTSLLLLVLIATILSYISLGASGSFSGKEIVSITSSGINKERAQSLEFRFDNEKILSDKAREKMVFGWGGWGRSRVYDQWGKDISITDSLWIIAFGTKGIVGLASLTASLLLPVIVFVQCFPAKLWSNPQVAPAAALAVLLALYMLDCVLNAMINPIYTLACGGIAGLALKQIKTRKVKTRKVIGVS